MGTPRGTKAETVLIRDRRDLLKLRPFARDAYKDYALTTLTAYVVHWLQKWGIPTSLENVAVASHRMFPVKFGMVGWSEFPDVNRTNRSVLQMRPKYRNLATSASDRGVFLNQRGVEEATALIAKLGPPVTEAGQLTAIVEEDIRPEVGKRARSIHPETDVEAVRRSSLFELYSSSRFDEAEAIDLIGLLDVYDHTPSKEKRTTLRRLMESAKEVKDREVVEFLDKVQARFHRYLHK
jgi:hypothetical protein